MRKSLQLEEFKDEEENQEVNKIKIIKNLPNRNVMHTSTSIASGGIGEVDGCASREVSGDIIIEGNTEVERHNNNNDSHGIIDLRENERNNPPTPSINNHNF